MYFIIQIHDQWQRAGRPPSHFIHPKATTKIHAACSYIEASVVDVDVADNKVLPSNCSHNCTLVLQFQFPLPSPVCFNSNALLPRSLTLPSHRPHLALSPPWPPKALPPFPTTRLWWQ